VQAFRLGLLLVMTSSVLAPKSSAQDITVLVVEAKTGRVYANETVELHALTETAPGESLEQSTGPDGRAVFHLQEPTPPLMMISFRDIGSTLYPCYNMLPLDVKTVVEKGMVAFCTKRTQACRCKFGTAVSQLKVSPGTVVLPVRVPTSFERFWWKYGYWD
jgi:hypothetical protein